MSRSLAKEAKIFGAVWGHQARPDILSSRTRRFAAVRKSTRRRCCDHGGLQSGADEHEAILRKGAGKEGDLFEEPIAHDIMRRAIARELRVPIQIARILTVGRLLRAVDARASDYVDVAG